MTATASASPTTADRFEGGFDHLDPAARDGWAVLWRAAERERCVLDANGSVWAWDQRGRSWRPMPADQEGAALRDHHRALNRLRRALLTVRALDSKIAAERDAACHALQRIGTALIEDWYRQDDAHGARWADGWFDHPAALYVAVTHTCRNFFPEEQRLPFDARVFTDLVARAHQDYAARRRPQPPRLRPEDVPLLQLRAEPEALSESLPESLPESLHGAQPAQPAAPKATMVDSLREELAATVAAEDLHAAERQRRLRKLLLMGMGSTGLAQFLAAARKMAGKSTRPQPDNPQPNVIITH